MPYVHIRSLPRAGDFDPAAAAQEVSAALARDAGIGEAHITVTWEWLDAHVQDGSPAPDRVLVDLHAPDSHPSERIETMLRSVAGTIARQAGVATDQVFASFRPAQSGQVFDGGEIVRW